MKSNQRRVTCTLGALAGGLLAAAFLPVAVAFADQYDFTPDPTTFVPSQVEGYPPLINEVTGAEKWSLIDLTTNSVHNEDLLSGTDTVTTIGSFTNDDFLYQNPVGGGVTIFGLGVSQFVVTDGTQIDLANFGFGYENAWMDIPSGPDAGISDLLITPFGDFEVLGSGFSELATVLG